MGTEFTDRKLSGTGAILVAVVKRQICVASVIETWLTSHTPDWTAPAVTGNRFQFKF